MASATAAGVGNPLPSPATALVAGLVFFWSVYFASRLLFARWSVTAAAWAKMSPVQRSALASLGHSTVHGIIIPIALAICLSRCGLWGDFGGGTTAAVAAAAAAAAASGPDGGGGQQHASCGELEVVFTWTIAYFLMDFVLLLIDQGDDWKVYVLHHLIGIGPYVINSFVYPNMQFLVSAGLLIEVCNPLLNVRSALDMLGMHDSEYSAAATYVTFIVWIPARIFLPLYLMFGMVTVSIPAFGFSPLWILPTYLTGTLITVFCIAVAATVLWPKVAYYWRGEHRRSRKKARDDWDD